MLLQEFRCTYLQAWSEDSHSLLFALRCAQGILCAPTIMEGRTPTPSARDFPIYLPPCKHGRRTHTGIFPLYLQAWRGSSHRVVPFSEFVAVARNACLCVYTKVTSVSTVKVHCPCPLCSLPHINP